MITRKIKNITVEFISDFEAEVFDKFINLMEKIFVKKEIPTIEDKLDIKNLNVKYRNKVDPFYKFSICDLIYVDFDLGAYLMTLDDDVYKTYNLESRNLKFAYHVYDNVLVIKYDKKDKIDCEKIIIKNVFNVILDENSFIWNEYTNNISKYDTKINKFIDTSKLNEYNFKGKYNLNYRNLYKEEVDLLDYIVSTLKENINYLENIDCTKVLNFIINNKNIQSGRIEKNFVIIDNDKYELNISSNSKNFYICYTRFNYKDHFTKKKTTSNFYINFDKNVYPSEISYKPIDYLNVQICDNKSKVSNTVILVNEMIYDLNQIK